MGDTRSVTQSGGAIVPAASKARSVLRKIRLGVCPETVASFRTAMKDEGVLVDEYGDRALSNSVLKVSRREVEVEPVVTSVGELGFECGTTYDKICSRAKGLGWELFSIEAVLRLRLQYINQPIGEHLVVATEPVVDRASGNSYLFTLSCDGVLCLGADAGGFESFYAAHDQFVFALRRR